MTDTGKPPAPSVLSARGEQAPSALAAEKLQKRPGAHPRRRAKHNERGHQSAYAELIDKYPDSQRQPGRGRGWAWPNYRRGEMEKAQKCLKPSPPRPHCELRRRSTLAESTASGAPRVPDDAVAAGKRRVKMKEQPKQGGIRQARPGQPGRARTRLLEVGLLPAAHGEAAAAGRADTEDDGGGSGRDERIQQKHGKHDVAPQRS